MKWFLVFIAVMVELVAIAQTEPTPLRSVQEGTYFLDGMFQTTILELKGGRFRYWFRSDLRFGKEPSYPLTGTYTTNGGTISFELQLSTLTNPFDKTEKAVFVTERWEFMNYKGQTNIMGHKCPRRLEGESHAPAAPCSLSDDPAARRDLGEKEMIPGNNLRSQSLEG